MLLRKDSKRVAVRVRLLACFVAFTVTACEPAAPAQERWPLQPSSEPLRDDDEAYELGAHDSVRWLEDGRLLVELATSSAPYRHVTRIWVAFDPGVPAHVEVQGWSEETTSNARWAKRDFVGQAWVSSDGTGLGQPHGPDLRIDLEYRAWQSGSDGPGGRRVHLRADQLEQALGSARPPGAFDLAPSDHSLLQIEAEPLESSDSVRWLEDGRLFVEWTRKPGMFRETRRLWIDLAPGRPARVRAALWTHHGVSDRPSTLRILSGRAWVSAGDPDLIVELDLLLGNPISPGHARYALAIPRSALAR